MVFTKRTLNYFNSIPYKIRVSLTETNSYYPFLYKNEPFFVAYNALTEIWIKNKSQRVTSGAFHISRTDLRNLENDFINNGTISLLKKLSFIDVNPALEKLVLLVNSSRQHENSSLILKLAHALDIENVTLDLIRQTARCYGFGQQLNEKDKEYFRTLQHLINSVDILMKKKRTFIRDKKNRNNTFFDFEHDPFQQRIELFKAISLCTKKRQIRPTLKKFGVDPNRYYILKARYMQYGVWGLVDLIQNTRIGEKISPELELSIIEEKMMDPSLSANRIIKKLNLQCSRANVQKIYTKWHLSKIKEPVSLRGLISKSLSSVKIKKCLEIDISAKMKFPNLIDENNLKVNRQFTELTKCLSYKKVIINNPGVFISAVFLNELGVVEALNTYGPESLRSSEITNQIIVNVLRIIAGFPTINDFMLNSDRSVAIASGLALNPKKSRFYDSLDDLRFEHLQKLRNDVAVRNKELGIIEGQEIAYDYHTDKSDSRFPGEKQISKAPDKNGDVVYAHRPQIIWDSIKNTIINIAYCEGKSRAPSALYKFCEENLFKIIEPDAIKEIYADSEYTGEKQIVYLKIRTKSEVTMCLKQNPRIKIWKEETTRKGNWEDYDDKYKIASCDFVLAETKKPFRFVIKTNKETGETRCFGSTHIDYSPKKILNNYHIRWPVETGIKELIENYFLNNPTGTSPEKVETHYYAIMIAKSTIDYFQSILCESNWKGPQDWKCLLSTIRNTVFSNENCELTLNDEGDFLITYLDGDKTGIKGHIAQMLDKRKAMGLNKVSWWGNRGVQIKVTDQYNFGQSGVKT